MRLLRNIVLIVLPILLMVNLYNWIFTSSSGGTWVSQENFKGFAYIHQYMQTFPGISGTLDLIGDIQDYATELNGYGVNNLVDVFAYIGQIAKIVFTGFMVPVMIVADICRDVYWFISILFVK